MQHNFVLAKVGTEQEILAAAEKVGLSKEYLPNSPNIIANTHLVSPGKSETITITVPNEKGKAFPYFCTVPGHSETMKGVLYQK